MKKLVKNYLSISSNSVKLTIIYSVPFLLVFSALLTALMLWEAKSHEQDQIAEFVEAGSAFHNQMIAAKTWNEKHKGIYVRSGLSTNSRAPSASAAYEYMDYGRMAGEMSKIADSLGYYKFLILNFPYDPEINVESWTDEQFKSLSEGKEIYFFTEKKGERYFHFVKLLSITNPPLSGPGSAVAPQEMALISIPMRVSDAVHTSKMKRILISFLLIGLISACFIVVIISKFSRQVSLGFEQEIEKNKLRAAVDLAGATAHEMRQPLSVVIGFSELVRDKASRGQDLEYELNIVKDECFKMNDIITKMLNITHYKIKHYTDGVNIFDLHAQRGKTEVNTNAE